ncbi:unnamed protein product [Gongylonema pulchrum]|uniref:RT_RNaseH_2 domain-containing protein n=1 Tax=Gongylonema pulchrum TaxID=637853 RepID=A0A183D3D9_9BILA|nr:unnamed protein product [Gongylonema pulchrum]
MYQIEENDKRALLYKSECQLFAQKILWKPFKLLKTMNADAGNRGLEIVCYSRDDHAKCLVIGQFITTWDMLLNSAEQQNTFYVGVLHCALS